MKDFEHGGNIYNVSGQAEDCLDMSANINALGMSEAVKSAVLSGIDGLIHYPDPQARELKNTIAARYNLNFNNIITLNGAAEFFYLFLNTFRPQQVLIPVPSFSEYERAAKAAGCQVHYFTTCTEANFNIDFDKLLDTVRRENINCLILGNPNNPTGTLLDRAEVLRILDAVDFVVVDESFVDFLGDDYSVRQLIRTHINLIVVHSLTKFFAIPGLRLGFAAADEGIIKRLESGKDVWNVNYLAQKAGVAALNDIQYITSTRRLLAAERTFFKEHLQAIESIKVFEPTVNFVLMKFKTPHIAGKVIDELKRQKILVRSCGNFRGLDGSYIRTAIRSRQENIKLFESLNDTFGGEIYGKRQETER